MASKRATDPHPKGCRCVKCWPPAQAAADIKGVVNLGEVYAKGADWAQTQVRQRVTRLDSSSFTPIVGSADQICVIYAGLLEAILRDAYVAGYTSAKRS